MVYLHSYGEIRNQINSISFIFNWQGSICTIPRKYYIFIFLRYCVLSRENQHHILSYRSKEMKVIFFSEWVSNQQLSHKESAAPEITIFSMYNK